MIEFFKSAVRAAKEKNPKYKMDFTVMQQVVKDPMPIKVPKEQKKKSLTKTPIQYSPPKPRDR